MESDEELDALIHAALAGENEEEEERKEEENILMEALVRLTDSPTRRDSKLLHTSTARKVEAVTASTSCATNDNDDDDGGKTMRKKKKNVIGPKMTCKTFGKKKGEEAAERPSPPLKTLNGKGKLSASINNECSHDVETVEDEKQLLSAIVNALHDKQSSVSGELMCGEGEEVDDYNVDGILHKAEEIAVASIQKKNQENRIMHLHEHIEMRDELQKVQGSVGWPSCICARTFPVVIDVVETPKESQLSSSLLKRPTLCVGTTLGVILLFDAKKKLCGMLGTIPASISTTSKEGMRGGVVSLSMSYDASTVVSGHERGTLVLWDTDSLTPLREIMDEFTTPITRLKHCYMDSFKVVMLSSTGHVKLLSFTRIMLKMIYRLTHITSSVMEAPYNDVDVVFMKEEGCYLVAAVSAHTLLISLLECGLANISTPISRYTQQHASPPESTCTHELVRFLSTCEEEDRVFLCVSWGMSLEVYSIAVGGKITNLHRILSIHLEKPPLHAMTPIIDSSLLLFLDSNQTLHLFDASAGVIVESRALHGFNPVTFSGSKHYHPGMRYNGGTVVYTGKDVFLLGQHRALTCSLLSWNARLDALVEKRRFPEALELAKSFALEVALGVVGLRGNSADRRVRIHSYIIHLISEYLMYVITSTAHPSQEEYLNCISCILQFCSEIDAMDIFFGPVMKFISNNNNNNNNNMYYLALYSLESFILSGAVTYLPDMYIEPFFDIFASDKFSIITQTTTTKAELSYGRSRVERALMCVDCNEDILMHIAKQNNLTRLVVFILSYRQHKYIDAFRYALEKEKEKDKTKTKEEQEEEESIALLFFESCMDGYTLCRDVEFSYSQRQEVKKELWSHLLHVPSDMNTLLHIDPEHILFIILLSLQEEEEVNDSEMCIKIKYVSQLFLLLVGVEISSEEVFRPLEILKKRKWPPYVIIHQLFTGLTHLVLNKSLTFPHPSLLQRFCAHASSHFIYQFQVAENELDRRCIQNDLAALMTDDGVIQHINFSYTEKELHLHHMSRVLSALYCSRLQYTEAIDCFLSKENNVFDKELSRDIFSFLREVMNQLLHLKDEERIHALRDAIMKRIVLLGNIDVVSLAQFVLDFLPNHHADVIHILKDSHEIFLHYLHELIVKRDSAACRDMGLQNTYIELLCLHKPGDVYKYLRDYDSLIVYDFQTVLNLVKRCRIADATVFLLEKTWMMDEAMDIIVDDIIEKLQCLREEVLQYVLSLSMGENKEHTFTWTGESALLQVLNTGITVCRKYNDHNHDNAEKKMEDLSHAEESWFHLLELFTRPRRLLCDREKQHQAAALMRCCVSVVDTAVNGYEDNEISLSLTRKGNPPQPSNSTILFPLLSSPLSPAGVMFLEYMIAMYTKYASFLLVHMIRALDPSSVMRHIVEGDPERERFGPFKLVIVDVMSRFNYEVEVNRLCKMLIDNDVVLLRNKLYRGFNKGIVSLSDECYVCEGSLEDARGRGGRDTSVRIFNCGHGFHEKCAGKMLDVNSNGGGVKCVQCCKEHRKMEKSSFIQREACKEEGEQEEEREKDSEEVLRVIRRLQQTRAKLDGEENYGSLISGFLPSNGISVSVKELLNESTEEKLVTPTPSFPLSIGECSLGGLNVDTLLTAGLTDEELLELFGAQEEEEDEGGEDDDDDDDGNNNNNNNNNNGNSGEGEWRGVKFERHALQRK